MGLLLSSQNDVRSGLFVDGHKVTSLFSFIRIRMVLLLSSQDDMCSGLFADGHKVTSLFSFIQNADGVVIIISKRCVLWFIRWWSQNNFTNSVLNLSSEVVIIISRRYVLWFIRWWSSSNLTIQFYLGPDVVIIISKRCVLRLSWRWSQNNFTNSALNLSSDVVIRCVFSRSIRSLSLVGAAVGASRLVHSRGSGHSLWPTRALLSRSTPRSRDLFRPGLRQLRRYISRLRDVVASSVSLASPDSTSNAKFVTQFRLSSFVNLRRLVKRQVELDEAPYRHILCDWEWREPLIHLAGY
jgi:hypothetical protein